MWFRLSAAPSKGCTQGSSGPWTAWTGLVARWQGSGLFGGSGGQEPRLDCVAFARRFHHHDRSRHRQIKSSILPLLSHPTARQWLSSEGSLRGVVSDLYVVPVAGGTPKRLTFDKTWIFGSPTWTPDGREIVFSSARGGLGALWRISASGGTPRPVAGVGVIAWSPSISPKGNQLVYQQMAFKDSIFRLDLKDETHRQGPPRLSPIRERASIGGRSFLPTGRGLHSNRMPSDIRRFGLAIATDRIARR